jgi:hypothetical protein
LIQSLPLAGGPVKTLLKSLTILEPRPAGPYIGLVAGIGETLVYSVSIYDFFEMQTRTLWMAVPTDGSSAAVALPGTLIAPIQLAARSQGSSKGITHSLLLFGNEAQASLLQWSPDRTITLGTGLAAQPTGFNSHCSGPLIQGKIGSCTLAPAVAISEASETWMFTAGTGGSAVKVVAP